VKRVTTLLEHGQVPTYDGKHPKVKSGVANVGDLDYTDDFFGKQAFLTVSGQLNVECYATALSDVYTFGPTFRAENSNTTRHLAEFWMIEPEICFATLHDDMNLAEDFVKCVTREVMTICREDLEFFEERIEKGLIKRLENVLEAPFERLTYRRAIGILNDHIKQGKVKFEEMDLHFGTDLGSEHERYLTEQVFNKPVILTNYPAAIKAFYMKRSEEDPETVEAMDVLVPKIGELVGGSARETDLALLEEKMHAMELENDWYKDLRKYGSVPHAGFGVGFERLIMFVTGITNIRDVIPFPRFPKNVEF
jgi:asparaginyl-tRNA synthetase